MKKYLNIPSLNDNKHIVDPEAEKQKWDEIVKGTETKAERAAQPVWRDHGQHHGEQAHDREVDLEKSLSLLEGRL